MGATAQRQLSERKLSEKTKGILMNMRVMAEEAA